jgi:hypothetical protein
MPVDSPTRSPWLRQLPPVVAAAVRARRGEVLATATGRVLDLDDPAFTGLFDGTASPEADGDEVFDTIVSTARLVSAPDLGWTLRALVARLAPHGSLIAVEPVGRAGPLGLVAASLGTCLPGVDGLHLSRDVPATVRSTGLTVIDLDRFTVATLVWPLRRFVQLRAVRLAPAEVDA